MVKLKANISHGKAHGYTPCNSQPISFLENIDKKTGVVIGSGHELVEKNIKGKVTVFPSGKGSTVGSYAIYRLRKNGAAPLTMINVKAEHIVAAGAIISNIPRG